MYAMNPRHYQAELERLGLSAAEAHIYLTLLAKGGAWRPTAVAATMHIPRSTVYLALNSLLERGLVEAEPGYGGRFSAVPAEQALPSLVAAEKEEILQRQEEVLQREKVAGQLGQELRSLASPGTAPVGEVVQVLRDPRSVNQHFQRLQLAAKKTVEVFCKPPYLNPDDTKTERRILQRGVQVRGIYERTDFDDPCFQSYFQRWFSAGREARVYNGKLPHKMVIIDSEIVLLPLFTPGEQMRALLIRNAQLAESLSVAFRFIWASSTPVRSKKRARRSKSATAAVGKLAPANHIVIPDSDRGRLRLPKFSAYDNN
jgi:sugar-specific transcriptional regulator TrmB